MLKKLQNLFLRVIAQIEGNPTPLKQYFLLFAAILALRLTLEFFSSHRLFRLDDIIHIGLWFVFIVLAFLLQLQFFSGEKMQRIVKLVVVSFTIALTAPIIDLLISGGQGAKMNYLSVNSWADFWWNYFTAGGTSITRGATLGIRIEIALLVIAAFNYIKVKSGSIFRAIVGSISIYTVLVLSGIVPMAMNYIGNLLELSYGENDRSTILLLLSIDLSLLFIAFYRHSPSRMRELLKEIPWMGIGLGSIPFLVGIGLAQSIYPANWSLNPTSLLHFGLLPCLVISLASLAGIQLRTTRMTAGRDSDLSIKRGLFLLIALIAFAISEYVFFMAMLAWGLLFLTYESPLKLIKFPLLRNLMLGMGFCAFALLGFVAFGGPMVGFPKTWLFSFLFLGMALSLFGEFSGQYQTLFPWYADWKASSQKRFFWICFGLTLVLPLIGGLLLKNEPGFVWSSILLFLFPAIHFYFRPTKPTLTYALFSFALSVLIYFAWI